MRPKLDLPNCLAILRACDKRPRTMAELTRATGLHRTTVFRTIRDMREQLQAQVVFRDDRWTVADWGIIDRARIAHAGGSAAAR